MCEALENENKIRRDCNNGSDLLYSNEDLKLGIKRDLAELTGGRRIKFTLGCQGIISVIESCFLMLRSRPSRSYIIVVFFLSPRLGLMSGCSVQKKDSGRLSRVLRPLVS